MSSPPWAGATPLRDAAAWFAAFAALDAFLAKLLLPQCRWYGVLARQHKLVAVNTAVSLVHAVASSWLVVRNVFRHATDMQKEPIHWQHPDSDELMSMVLGYFGFDTVSMALRGVCLRVIRGRKKTGERRGKREAGGRRCPRRRRA